MARVAVNKKGLDRDPCPLACGPDQTRSGVEPTSQPGFSQPIVIPGPDYLGRGHRSLIAIEAERILSISQHGN